MSARRRLVAGLSALTLVGTLLGAGVAAGTAASAATGVPAAALAAADEVVETNVALIAEPTVSYVPGWNKASALNDGTEATPDGHGSVWGTYGQFEPQHWAQYDWQWPVTVSRSAVWFWNDANGSANVLSPAAWHLEYKDAAGDFQPVDVATYPIATGTAQVLGPNTVTFTPVTTTALRIVLDAQERGTPDPYYAVAATEWQAWGTGGTEPEEPVDPDAPIAVEDVAVRTLVGQAPSLPDEVWVLPENGPLTYVDATWDPVPAGDVGEIGTAAVVGTAGTVDLSATVHVVADLASPVDEVDHTTTITTPGVAPVCARSVTAWHTDGSADSTTPVTWDAADPADYAEPEQLFVVEGEVAGFAPPVECTVWVIAPVVDEEAPGVVVDVDSAPASSGWYTTAPQVSVRVVEGGAPVESVELRIGDGDWQPYTEPVTVDAQGAVTVAARATDTEDRTGEGTRALKIDTRAPVTGIDHVRGATSATFTLTPTDPEPGAGLSRTLFSYGPSTDPESSENVMWATYDEPFGVSLDADRPVYVHVRSQDLAGNQEETRTVELAATGPLAVTPAAPVLTAPRCVEGEAVDGSLAIPATTGVVYRIGGATVTGTVAVPAGQTVTVVARPATGYTFVGDAQVVSFVVTAAVPDCTPAPRHVEPGTVTVTGTPTVGRRLTATAAGWGPDGVRLAYQWYADGTAVLGGNAPSLVLTPAHAGATITVRATGFGDGLVTASLMSGPVGRVARATFVAPRPTVAGTLKVGSTLTARLGTWQPAPTGVTYRWLADGTTITGATGSTLRLTSKHVGKKIAVAVTGTRAGYTTVTVTSVARTWSLQAGAVTISGTPAVGKTLRADPGTWGPGTVTLRYQWKVNGVAVTGATSRTYTVRGADRGDKVTVTVTGSKTGFPTTSRTSGAVRIR
ncbi:Ig domain protein [Cellulomonas gilvus]|uniref:Ig domain protein n=1 Tax=Cellulomonas gilvus (strain ATCC 13127 / NRRL B-14078) TaxID=593907 RepID=F8A5T6_CELGA|nr:Ig domain protein [Cellulomonas gilvus]AEI13376.1 Ig domain protein [Cellulomonas gilvus ATCC 13127]